MPFLPPGEHDAWLSEILIEPLKHGAVFGRNPESDAPFSRFLKLVIPGPNRSLQKCFACPLGFS